MKCLPVLMLLLLVLSPAARADEDRVTALERKVDALTRELDALRLGAPPADTGAVRLAPLAGLGPAASRVYGGKHGVSIGGYGEALLTRIPGRREDGVRGPTVTSFDVVRAVVSLGYRFDDRLLLNSELEWEHAGVRDEASVAVNPGTGRGSADLSGEASLEFGYLEWARTQALGLRAGLLLVPVGLTNEMHEPLVTLAARRPRPEDLVIPTTWS